MECADCHAALVAVLPPPSADADLEHPAPDYSTYLAVLDTADNFALHAATDLLEEAEIPYIVSDEPHDVRPEVFAADHKWWVIPYRIFVAPEFEKEARELLETFANPEILDTSEKPKS